MLSVSSFFSGQGFNTRVYISMRADRLLDLHLFFRIEDPPRTMVDGEFLADQQQTYN